MSELKPAYAGPAGLNPRERHYQLSDDLAKLCLPQEWKDSYRTLAWVNSVCALFLLVGLVGLKAPRVIIRPLSEVTDVVPVIFTPPDEPPPPTTEIKPDEMDETPTDAPVETPQVVTIVAAADPTAVAFAVPVPGAVAIAPRAQLATPPPPVNAPPPPKPVQFNPNAASGQGSFPPPEYPASAQRNRYQGTVIIDIKVEPSGDISAATVFKSSGFTMLDDAALQVVQKRWRFTPGQQRWFQWPCMFKMQ
jgi:periplasmic protein TonB